jgi:hypothetical protein
MKQLLLLASTLLAIIRGFQNNAPNKYNYKAEILQTLLLNNEEPEESDYPDIVNNRILRPWKPDDDAAKFFKKDYYTTLITDLPAQGKATNAPWSGYYWAIRYGIGSLRYSDDMTINTMYRVVGRVKYKRTYPQSVNMYLQPSNFKSAVSRGMDLSTYVEKYASPTEKYDIAVGDSAFTLTNYMKNRGKFVNRYSNGDVADWMGICHGWSVAAYEEPKPLKSITVIAADGKTKVKFRPHDIMAIASMYWANSKSNSNFTGYKCAINSRSIPRDASTGIWLDYKCWGLNPGTFHIILTNQMGLNGKSFVFDPNNTDYEIWNFPVSSYKVEYFEVTDSKAKSQTSTTDAMVTVDDANAYLKRYKDNFLRFVINNKNPATVYLLGVKCIIVYAVENQPSTKETTEDITKTKTFTYYLELDASFNIIGGEWKDIIHPNFVWGPYRPEDEKLSNEDLKVSMFSGYADELKNMSTYAVKASASGRPLRAFMKYLTYTAGVNAASNTTTTTTASTLSR